MSNLERAARVLPTIAYMAAIFIVSAIPSQELPVPSALDDSLLHFVAYFGLGLLLMFSAAVFDGSAVARLTGAGMVGVLYGASDEWHQSFVPQRDSSLSDLGFDAAGVLTALLLVYLLLRRSTSR